MLCDLLSDAFGSWPNVNSGLIGNTLGSAIGVFGAYWVASHQMRSDRLSQRQATGATAAAEIHERLHDVGRQLTFIKNHDERDVYPDRGISDRRRREWHDAQEAYLIACTLRVHLLPESMNASLLTLTERLRDDVLVWNWMDEEILESVDPANGVILEEVEAMLATTRKQLTDYIRDAVGDRRKSSRYSLKFHR